MTPKAFVGLAIVAAVLVSPGAIGTASADESEALKSPIEGPPLPRVQLSVEGPEEAVLEERIGSFEDREAGWRQLCSLPCQTGATADPYARHRIVDGRKTRSVTIHARGGEPLVLRYERAPASTGLLVGGGVVVGVVGVVLAVVGLAGIASNAGPSYEQLSLCSGDAACQSRWHQADADADAIRAPGRTLAAVGGVTALVGGIAILVGALTTSSAQVVRRAPVLQGRF